MRVTIHVGEYAQADGEERWVSAKNESKRAGFARHLPDEVVRILTGHDEKVCGSYTLTVERNA